MDDLGKEEGNEKEREGPMTFAADWKQKLRPIERRGRIRQNKGKTPDQKVLDVFAYSDTLGN